MDESVAFLRAIAAEPADDLPRLAFADYLEETGTPDSLARAHFIRAQIAMTHWPPGSTEFAETLALQNRLFTMYSQDWIWDVPERWHRDGDPAWRRGFVEFLRLDWDELFDEPELFATVPITRVQTRQADWRRLAPWPAAPHLKRITHLQIGPGLRPDVLDRDSEDRPGVLQHLLQSADWAGVQYLNLSGNNINAQGLAEFLLRLPDSPMGPRLRTLDLADIRGVDDAVGSLLATARGLENLERLGLSGCELSEAVRHLLRRRFGERCRTSA